jgi:polyphosphate glucokinase
MAEGAGVRYMLDLDWGRGVMSQSRTLAIDIGGTGIKAALLDDTGSMIGERQRVPTPPKPVAPEELVRAIDEAVTPLGAFERVSVGFPGYVRDGRVLTAPNLGSDTLANFDLQSVLAEHLGKPVRVLNDADVQGFGAIKGSGVEMVLTLGTGAGTAIFRDGEIMPHLELAHHPVSGNKTYDEYIGNAARKRKGRKTWNKRVTKVIEILREVVRFDHLYIGGGNAKDITFALPADVTIVPNTDGLTGGIRLWRTDPKAYVAADVPSSEAGAAEPDAGASQASSGEPSQAPGILA